jgi:thiamine biosynthesis lipoprotein
MAKSKGVLQTKRRSQMQIPIKWCVVVMLVCAFGCAAKSKTAPATHPSTTPVRASLQRYEYSQVLMGVQVRLVLYTTNEEASKTAARAAFARVAELEDIMSDYRPDSELMRLSRTSGSGWSIAVSKELYEVLAYAHDVSQASGGAFDVTVGPLVQFWRQARETKRLPDAVGLATSQARVGWQKIVFDPPRQSVLLTARDMRLDLGGIAKGYAGDEAIRVLREHGVASALFEAGGDVVVSDAPPDSAGWRIETQDARVLTLANEAVSTSGDTEQFVEIGGVRYSHVVDPRTGIGLTDQWAATVVAPRGVTTDALSTACTVLGPTKSQALVKRFGARAWVRKVTRETSSRQSSTTSRANP